MLLPGEHSAHIQAEEHRCFQTSRIINHRGWDVQFHVPAMAGEADHTPRLRIWLPTQSDRNLVDGPSDP